ncbi:MAG: polyprenol monophosphomannose synthase [Patescibacteria group bacterium]
MPVFIVIPTYNEKENLPVLLEKIFDLKIPDLKALVVDDNSPDGTGRLADELKLKYPNLAVLHRQQKEGLGRAYVTAFKTVLTSYRPDKDSRHSDYIVQMDADLSHDPAVIPTMLDKIKTCHLVIGSRYIKGGRTVNWDFFRKLISRFGNFYARIVLGLPYKDLTGGFKCWRREVLEKIDLESLSSTGYNFQIETTYKAHQLKFNICETPITFTERKTGKSKFNFRIMLEAFWKVLMLRIRT